MNILVNSVLKRNHQIIEQDSHGFLLQDNLSSIYFCIHKDEKVIQSWIHKHKDIDLLVLENNIHLHGFTCFMSCFEFVYTQKESLIYSRQLQIRQANPNDLSFILAHYDILDETEILEIISMHQLFIGLYHQIPIGCIGQHIEGSMGLLFVIEEFRGHGFGKELEMFLINHLLSNNQIPFGQVEVNNIASISLQQKLGLISSKSKQYWYERGVD
ncbi:GNAT family N-acetyltransferase [Floccifex sp.]|uniref:GNAT family N-acetyltransferase n=1 Tax=Floccifex sp. TaxID=2815810 RepID=UPI003F089460